MALGLAVLASAPGLALWYAAWTVLGIGMALGLYDAAFATIGRLLGTEAGPSITGVTLIAGFASSVFWPAGVAFVHLIGWRETLLGYAGVQLAVNLPLVLLLVPPAAGPAAGMRRAARARRARSREGADLACQLLHAALADHVRDRGLCPDAFSVARADGARGGRRGGPDRPRPGARPGAGMDLQRPDRGAGAGADRGGAVPAGGRVLPFGGPVAVCVFAVLYGMSNGILTVNRGTLPMMIFGPAGYAALIGWLAVPTLLAQAAAPTLAAPLVAALPALDVLLLAGGLAAVALCLLLPLHVAARHAPLPRASRPPRPARIG